MTDLAESRKIEEIDRSGRVASVGGHRSPISGVDSFAASYVATAGYDSRVTLWDRGSGAPIASACHDHLVNQCRFSPDGRFLLTASSDYTARIWAVPLLAPVATLHGQEDDVEMASWSASGTRVATASRDYRLRIFDTAGSLQRTIVGHTADVISVEWLADDRELVSSSDDGTVRRWDCATGAELERYPLGGETDTVVVTTFGIIFAGNDRGEILTLRDGVVSTMSCHAAGIKRLVLHEGSRRLMSASYDRSVKIWLIEPDGDLTLIQQTEVPSVIWLRSAAFAGRDSLLFGTFGSTYAEFSLTRGTWDVARVGDTFGVNSACVHDDAVYSVGDAGIVRRNDVIINSLGSLCNFIVAWGSRIVTGGQLGILFDAVSGEVLCRHRSPLNCGATWRSGDGEMLAIGSYTGEALVFEQAVGGAVRFLRSVSLHDNAIKGLSCNGKSLFSVCATAAAAFHDVVTFGPVAVRLNAHDKIANGAAGLRDGSFVSVSRDRKLRFWTPAHCRALPTPHDHSIKCVSVLRSANFVATGSYDGKVAVYDCDRDEWPIVRQISRFGISSLAADEADSGFLATCYDGQIYRIATG